MHFFETALLDRVLWLTKPQGHVTDDARRLSIVLEMQRRYPLICAEWGLEYTSWWNGGFADTADDVYDHFQLSLRFYIGTVEEIVAKVRHLTISTRNWAAPFADRPDSDVFVLVTLEEHQTPDLRLEWTSQSLSYRVMPFRSGADIVDTCRDLIDVYYDEISITKQLYWSRHTVSYAYAKRIESLFQEVPLARKEARLSASTNLEATSEKWFHFLAQRCNSTGYCLRDHLDSVLFDSTSMSTARSNAKPSATSYLAFLRFCRRAVTKLVISELSSSFSSPHTQEVTCMHDALLWPACRRIREYPEQHLLPYQELVRRLAEVNFPKLTVASSSREAWPLWAHELAFCLSEPVAALCAASILVEYLCVESEETSDIIVRSKSLISSFLLETSEHGVEALCSILFSKSQALASFSHLGFSLLKD